MFESDRDLPAVLAVLLQLVPGKPLTTQRTGGPLSRLLAQAGVAQTRAAGRVLLYHRPAHHTVLQSGGEKYFTKDLKGAYRKIQYKRSHVKRRNKNVKPAL